MARYAAVMMTDAWDPFVQRQFVRAAAHVRVGRLFVLVNGTRGPVPVPPDVDVQVVDEAAIRRLRLPIAYERSLFCYNVDYLYYAFFLEHPDYDAYVFFDYPVVVDLDLDAMVAAFGRDELDFVAEPVAGDPADWTFAKRHRDLYPPGVLRGALLPLAVLSKAAIAYLLQRRLQLARSFENGSFPWPFCEAFVPSELAEAGFRAAPLSDYGSVSAFTWWPPTLEAAIPAERRPGFLHPVLDRTRYVKATLEHMPSRELLNPHASRAILRDVSAWDYLGPFLAQAAARLWRVVKRGLTLDERPLDRSPAPAKPRDKTVSGI